MSLNPGYRLPDTQWLMHNTLPRSELVLLDGTPGVGKTCLIAYAVAGLCRYNVLQPSDSILYLTTRNQFALTRTFLQRHEPDYSRIQHVEYEHDEQALSCHLHFTQHVRALIEQHKPALLVIDSLEEIFADCSHHSRHGWRHIFYMLSHFASFFNCTIIVPRCHGNHESRAYGHFAREGSSIARFILTLHYHPIDPLARILILAKNQTGPIGSQMIARFQSNGQMLVVPLEHHEHVKPARAPATWRPTDPHEEENEAILEAVEDFMKGKPATKPAVKAHVLSKGFSERAYLRFISKAKMSSSRMGTPNWYFLPTNEMYFRTPQGQKDQETLTRTPRATPAADDQTPEKPAILTPTHPQPLRQAG